MKRYIRIYPKIKKARMYTSKPITENSIKDLERPIYELDTDTLSFKRIYPTLEDWLRYDSETKEIPM